LLGLLLGGIGTIWHNSDETLVELNHLLVTLEVEFVLDMLKHTLLLSWVKLLATGNLRNYMVQVSLDLTVPQELFILPLDVK